jgi:uncharacterized membrane protein YphA (DoxX/SURF4 family)/peroxiredoxin
LLESAVLGVRLLLSVTFGVAGTAKLADPQGSRGALRAFGVPGRLLVPLGVAIPVAELAAAVMLLVPSLARWGAMVGLALLLLFSVAIATATQRGRRPDCHCFGQLHSAPVGWKTLARNGALAGLAGFVLIAGWDDPGVSAVAWIGDLGATALLGLVGGALIGALAWVCFELLRQQGRLLLRIEALEQSVDDAGLSRSVSAAPSAGLPVGTDAPDFSLPSMHDGHVSLGSLVERGRPLMLVFSDPACGPCTALLPELAGWQEEHQRRLTIALISRGGVEANRMAAFEQEIEPLLLQEGDEVSTEYAAYGTPSAVLVSVERKIASEVGAGAAQIRGLVRRALGGADPRSPDAAGETEERRADQVRVLASNR